MKVRRVAWKDKQAKMRKVRENKRLLNCYFEDSGDTTFFEKSKDLGLEANLVIMAMTDLLDIYHKALMQEFLLPGLPESRVKDGTILPRILSSRKLAVN